MISDWNGLGMLRNIYWGGGRKHKFILLNLNNIIEKENILRASWEKKTYWQKKNITDKGKIIR